MTAALALYWEKKIMGLVASGAHRKGYLMGPALAQREHLHATHAH